MRAIKQDDILDVIYDSWYGLPLEEADKVVYDYVHKKMIPIEWIVNWITKQTIPATHTCDDYEAAEMMLDDWEKENEAN